MAHTTERRVVITGLGVVAANGIGKQAFWQSVSHGISGIKPIQRISTEDLPIKVAGEISNFIAGDYIDRKLEKRTDRMTHFVFAAVEESIQNAHITLTAENPTRLRSVMANTLACLAYS